jgi:hypothetical protein
MGYTMAVTMRDQQGAITRLMLLLSQRNLKLAQFTLHRDSPGTVTAVVGIDDRADRGPWALRQVSRHKDVLAARLLDADASYEAGQAVYERSEPSPGNRYRYRRRTSSREIQQGVKEHDRKIVLRRTRRSSVVNG